MAEEVARLQQQLQLSEREKLTAGLELQRKEAELTRAEETIRRQQLQIEEMVS